MELYKFARIPDLAIDTPHTNKANAAKELTAFYELRKQTYTQKRFSSEPFGQTAKLFHEHHIKSEYADAFFESMLQDAVKDRYQTYDELKESCMDQQKL